MIKEAIILAGGLGTRLQKVVSEIPKCMADINGKPFLEYLLNYLIEQKFERVILSVGYKYEVIQNYFQNQYCSLKIDYAIEKEPLGTGGGIKLSLEKISKKYFAILNGDTFFKVNIQELYLRHLEKNAELTIALKPMKNFDRYGTVEINSENKILAFREKQKKEFGLITGGTYIASKNIFDELNLPPKFLFENDFLEKYCDKKLFYGFSFDDYFIDIGIPDDYDKAKKYFDPSNENFSTKKKLNIDNSWALFLDRDGVISKKLENDYVKNWSEFEFLPDVLKAIAVFSKIFGKIIIVTNQRGLGKNLMTVSDLQEIHSKMLSEIEKAGGRIDAIHFCPHLIEENCNCRKPKIGMALQAKNHFPDIDFKKSVMVGDSLMDMEFGKRLEMKTVWINHDKNKDKKISLLSDHILEGLIQFAEMI